jgi:hypothetical protein
MTYTFATIGTAHSRNKAEQRGVSMACRPHVTGHVVGEIGAFDGIQRLMIDQSFVIDNFDSSNHDDTNDNCKVCSSCLFICLVSDSQVIYG